MTSPPTTTMLSLSREKADLLDQIVKLNAHHRTVESSLEIRCDEREDRIEELQAVNGGLEDKIKEQEDRHARKCTGLEDETVRLRWLVKELEAENAKLEDEVKDLKAQHTRKCAELEDELLRLRWLVNDQSK